MVFSKTLPQNFITMTLFANSLFQLPPKRKTVDVKVDCCIPWPARRKLYGYRVHAHDYSTNISLQIGDEDVVHGNPQLPHVFNKPEKALMLTPDMNWKVTCTYNTQNTDKPVNVGEGHTHEMCNMYFMMSSHVPMAGNCNYPGVYDPALQLSIRRDHHVKTLQVLQLP